MIRVGDIVRAISGSEGKAFEVEEVQCDKLLICKWINKYASDRERYQAFWMDEVFIQIEDESTTIDTKGD